MNRGWDWVEREPRATEAEVVQITRAQAMQRLRDLQAERVRLRGEILGTSQWRLFKQWRLTSRLVVVINESLLLERQLDIVEPK